MSSCGFRQKSSNFAADKSRRADFARKVVILQPIKADLVYESNQYNKGTRCHRTV